MANLHKVDTLLLRKYSDADLHRECTCFFLTIGDGWSRQYRSVSPIFVRVFCKMFLFLCLVENFSHKSSSGALLSLKKNKTVFFFFKLWPIYIRKSHANFPLLSSNLGINILIRSLAISGVKYKCQL